MANNAGNSLEYWISVKVSQKNALYGLRKWSDLKVAFEDNLIWVRGLSEVEIESTEVLKIPYLNRYYLNGTHLNPYGKSLPARIEPNLLWTPLQRGLKITLPKENFNYFGINQTYEITLVPSEENISIDATIVDRNDLEHYLKDSYDIRHKHLLWTVIDENKALIIGAPILPIRGQDLYRNNCFLIPAGWKLKYDNMDQVFKLALGESIQYWYLIDEENTMTKLGKSDFNLLSKGSFQNTFWQR